ncbi:MAG: hypothetical protein GY861_09730 [bacterium]|nr:hypothetical protein [bacterium]
MQSWEAVPYALSCSEFENLSILVALIHAYNMARNLNEATTMKSLSTFPKNGQCSGQKHVLLGKVLRQRLESNHGPFPILI